MHVAVVCYVGLLDQSIVMSLILKLAGQLPHSWVYLFARIRSHRPWIKKATDWIPDRLRDREGVIQSGAGRGLKFCAGGSAAGFLLGTHDPSIQRALTTLVKPGMVVYDVGANVGFTAMIAARLVGAGGRVICFEPQPGCSNVLRLNASLNGFSHVMLRAEALGDSDGSALFVVSENSTFSHLAAVGDTGEARGEIRVELRRLDTLLDGSGLPRPDLVKIDVEGAELQVLAGAASMLRLLKPVVLIELHGTNDGVANCLSAAGYATHVVGSRDDIRAAHWNALIVGVPRESDTLIDEIHRLTSPADLHE